MSLIFTELVLENFGPYRGKHIIDLRPKTEKDNSSIILFGGMNGGGKTTLIDAIRLALYGQRAECSTRKNLSYPDFLVQCINHNASLQEKTRVELSFEHIIDEQWVNLKIVRYWSKDLKEGKDNLGIIEGEWPDVALADIWDEYVENILPIGISNLFLFDGEQVKELAEQELPTPTVVNAIKSLLGLELADRLAIDLDILLTRKQKELSEGSDLTELEALETKLTSFEEDKFRIVQELERQQKKLKKAQKQYQQASSTFRTQGGKIAAQRQHLEDEAKKLAQQEEEIREELRILAAKSLPLTLLKKQLQTTRKQGEIELKYQQAKLAKDMIEVRNQRLVDYLHKLSLDIQYIHKIEKFLEIENQQLDRELNPPDIFLGANQKTLQNLKNIMDYILPNEQKLLTQKLNQIENLERNGETIQRKLGSAASPEAYAQLEQNLKQTHQQVIKAQTNYETSKQTLNAIEKEIQTIKQKLAKYSEKSLGIHQTEHLINSVAKVKNTLSLFKEKLTLKKLNRLESEVSDCFRFLLHKSKLVNRIVINVNNFALSLYDFQGNLIAKNRLSAGEKQLLAIALLWGLARVSGKKLPIAIDTPLGRLDSSHRHNLVERYFPNASHQVILLSTDTEITQTEALQLHQQKAIAKEYLLEYNSEKDETMIKPGYFWETMAKR